MIDYGKFQFASPPRTGTTWFIQVCHLAGLEYSNSTGNKSAAHKPFRAALFGVSIVRHPVHWLRSYYYSLQGGSVGIPCVDRFSKYAKQAQDFNQFIQLYLTEIPGAVGEMLNEYNAATVLKLEDISWSMTDFLESVGVKRDKAYQAASLPPHNITKDLPIHIDKNLRQKVVDAEKEMCVRYQYFR